MEEKQPTFSEQELDELCEEAIRYRDMGSKEGFDKAIELLTFASELGYADAKLYLAQSYTYNPALIDVEKAEYWYNEWYACEKENFKNDDPLLWGLEISYKNMMSSLKEIKKREE